MGNVFDGSSYGSHGGSGTVFETPTQALLSFSFKLDFECSNNVAEYKALILGLRMAEELNLGEIDIKVKAGHEPDIMRLSAALASKMQLNEADEGTVVVKKRALPSTWKEDAAFEQKDDWRVSYIEDLTKESDDQLLSTKILKQFVIIRGALYFRTPEGSLSRCVGKLKAQELLNRFHEESCRQTWGIPLYRRLQRMGVYSPNMAVQAAVIQDKCEDFQAPLKKMEMGTRHHWTDKSNFIRTHKYIITATEYSSKWVEAIPLRDYSGTTIATFIKEHIICHFDALMVIRSDNGTSFVNQTVKELLDQCGINFHTSTVYYPQGNGQAEATNKTLLKILSRMVHDHHRIWHEQLPLALWAYRISKISSTGASPYSLVYGEDCILPAEIAIPSARVAMASLTTPDEVIHFPHLDTLEERRAKAERFADKYRQRTARYYSQKVKERTFCINDIVMKIAPHVQRNEKERKFAANWEGPYMISEAAESGYYYLKRMNGSRINTPINGKWLKTYYA
ncbi:uncharacterized protein K02A2.6-like [Papaver somniferum]|uniref:uncharacterized protein K02A2.6-like n=1 Tax=Papaver somniferum TaxID=3469 RepID=UPI000E6FA256|nr:uncharacterized protein K02A2.6-like [Papaver somniferum]